MGLTSSDKHYDDLRQGLVSIMLLYKYCYILFKFHIKPLIVFYSVVNQNFLWDISEYVLSEKDNLVLGFARNLPMNNTLVNIENEFLLQRQICCLLEPERYLEDVVSIMFFILNNNTHATSLRTRKVIYLNKHRFSIHTQRV
jgi:hypothetical protein